MLLSSRCRCAECSTRSCVIIRFSSIWLRKLLDARPACGMRTACCICRRSAAADFGTGPGSTFVGCRRTWLPYCLDHEGPAVRRWVRDPVTQADEAHRARRTPRDWAVDTLCFLLGIGLTLLVFVDGTDRRLPTVPIAVDAALGVLASLGLWLRRRWPVGLAVIVGVFAIYSVSASAIALIALSPSRCTGASARCARCGRLRADVLPHATGPARRVAAELVAEPARRRLCRRGPGVGHVRPGTAAARPCRARTGGVGTELRVVAQARQMSATGSRGRCTTYSPIACRC